MKISREVKTAILALLAIGMVIFGYSFMKGQNIFDSHKEIYAVYDNVEGLSSSAGVTINGLKIGNVTSIRFLNESGKLLVTMTIASDFPFTDQSTAQIYSSGFISGKAIQILPANKGQLVQSGDTLPSAVKESIVDNLTNSLTPLQEKLESALTGIDSLVQGLNNVLDESGQNDLKEGLASLNKTMQNLSHTSAEIDQLLTKNATQLDTTINNISQTAYNFASLSDSLAQIEVEPLVRKIDGMLTNFNKISSKLNNGEGTLGKLINDNQMYENLEHASKQMEELIQDIKLHPRRYINLKFSIFGGKDKTPAYQKPDDPLN